MSKPCNLCHRPFSRGDKVYHFPRGDGTPEEYHMLCFAETAEGRMGYLPRSVTTYEEIESRLYIGLRSAT